MLFPKPGDRLGLAFIPPSQVRARFAPIPISPNLFALTAGDLRPTVRFSRVATPRLVEPLAPRGGGGDPGPSMLRWAELTHGFLFLGSAKRDKGRGKLVAFLFFWRGSVRLSTAC